LRIDSQKEGRFLDADAAKSKLKKLNSVLDKIRKSEMKGKHSIEVSNIKLFLN
jgi:hypothetical protein